MRARLGWLLHVAGLVLMPVALWEGLREGGSVGTELVLFAVGLTLVFLGRALRGGAAPK